MHRTMASLIHSLQHLTCTTDYLHFTHVHLTVHEYTVKLCHRASIIPQAHTTQGLPWRPQVLFNVRDLRDSDTAPTISVTG